MATSADSIRLREEKAAKVLVRFERQPTDDPTRVLLDTIAYQRGIVEYWRQRVETLSEQDLVWSLVGEHDAVTNQGDVVTLQEHRATTHIVYDLLQQAQKDLSAFVVAALRAGLAERAIQVAEQQGEALAGAQRAILSRMLDALSIWAADQGASDEMLRALPRAWAGWVGDIVPSELRALGGGHERGGP